MLDQLSTKESPIAGRPLGGDCLGPSSRHRGLSQQASRPEQETAWGGGGGEAESEAQGQAEVGGGIKSGCMTRPSAADGPSEFSGGCDTKKVYVPGSEAPSVKVSGLWNSFGRHLSRHGGLLASFFRCMCSSRPCPRDDGSPGAVVWPIPLPYPEIFRGRSVALAQAFGSSHYCSSTVVLG